MKYFIIIIISVSVSADDLKSVLKEIVELHPDVRKRTFLHKAARADSERAGTLPDPKIGLAYRNYPNYGGIRFDESRINTPTMTGREIQISQEIPYLEKNSLSKKIAKDRASESELDILSARNTLAASLLSSEVVRRYSPEKIRLRKEIMKLYSSAASVSRAYSAAGNKPAFLALQNTASETQERIRILEAESSQELNLLEQTHFAKENPELLEKLKSHDISLYLNALYDKIMTETDHEKTVIEKNPEIRKSQRTRQRLESEKDLSVLNSAAPDAEVFIAYMKRKNQKYMLDNGPIASASGNWMIQDSTEYRGDLISAGVTLKVPVWSLMNLESAKKSGQLNIDANREEKEMNIRTYSAVLKKMHAEIEYLRRAEKEYSGKLIPELEKTLRLAENSYRASKTEFSDIVNSRISLVQARLSLLEIRERQLLRLVSVLEITDSFFE